jgi:uncharacterized iron-regulated protein
MKKLLLATLLCPFLVSAQEKLSEKNYHIYSVKLGKEVSLKTVVEDMADNDVLFFGEEHNDSVTHYVEKTMLALMHDKYGDNLALSMEMFDRDVQPIMNEYLKGYIREKNFVKDARAWSNYRDYRPMVEYAKEKRMDVVCANAPGRYTNLVGRRGQQALRDLPRESREFFAPVPYDTATGDYYAKLTGLRHDVSSKDSGKAAPAMMPGFNLVMAQSLWDATMAYSIAEYLKEHRGKKVMQVNGKFHSDEGFAVANQLNKYKPKAKMLIISAVSDDAFPKIKWDESKHLGDYIIVTDPAVPRTYKD